MPRDANQAKKKRIDLLLVKLMATYNQEIKRGHRSLPVRPRRTLEISLTEFNRESLPDRSLFRFPSFTYLSSRVFHLFYSLPTISPRNNYEWKKKKFLYALACHVTLHKDVE